MTSPAEYVKILNYFKQDKSLETSMILLDNVPALKILSLWSKIKPKMQVPDSEPEQDEDNRWYWLWNNVDYHLDLLSSATGYSAHKIESIIRQIILARLAYPDGTISAAAEVAIQKSIQTVYKKSDKKMTEVEEGDTFNE